MTMPSDLPVEVQEALDRLAYMAAGDFATIRDHIATLIAERDDLLNQLGECFRMAGADPDGNENWRLARRALKAVTDLRRDYDENEDWKSRHDALAQRCAAAERDAARYRWLRDVAPSLSRGPMLAFCTGPDRADEITALDDADAAIDAAIHQETP
jgi:hypothetical protein